MAIDSGITWTDDTLNPWIGCTKVSPACDACYAEDMMDRRYHRVVWGKPGAGAGTRVQTKHWRSEIRKSEREAVAQWKVTGQPRFVFCLSLGDIFDNQVPAEWRRDVFEEIRKAPHCVFLLLTKRPQNIVRLFEEITEKDQEHDALSDYWPPNAAIGCTAVTQEEADRDVPVLLEAKRILGPTFAFLSIEPMLGPIDLFKAGAFRYPSHRSVDWVITGGESDQGAFKARPAHPQWFRDIRDQCAEAGATYHHKQNGEWASVSEVEGFDGNKIHEFPDLSYVRRVGLERAGRTIDGVVHDARPKVEAPWLEAA